MNLKVLMIAAVFAQMTAATTVVQPANVFDDARMTAFCVIGAIMGAFLAVALFPGVDPLATESNKIRKLSLQFGSSLVCGISFSPIFLRVCYWIISSTHPFSSDTIIAVSSLNAMLAVFAIHQISPKIERWLRERRSHVIITNVGDNSHIGSFQTGEHAKHER